MIGLERALSARFYLVSGLQGAAWPQLWLGAQEPWWAWNGDAQGRLLLSARRIKERASEGKGKPRRATVPLFIDSGAYTELALHGQWAWTAEDYADFIVRMCGVLGTVEHVGIQDWMCTPSLMGRTGKTVLEHQERTVASFFELRQLAPGVPWLPTLQGFTLEDYLVCAELYLRSGFDIRTAALVGLGSVCQRNGSEELTELIQALCDAFPGVPFHGFGIKKKGILASCFQLRSFDSMAWSEEARRAERELQVAVRAGLGLPKSVKVDPNLDILAQDPRVFAGLSRELADFVAWKRVHSPKSAANSHKFAEWWRLQQLEALTRELVDRVVGLDGYDVSPPMAPFH